MVEVSLYIYTASLRSANKGHYRLVREWCTAVVWEVVCCTTV